MPRAILQAAPGKTPADYTSDDLREIAIAITQEFYAAITSQPEPDLSRAKKTYSEACQPEDDNEFAAQIDALLELLDGKQLSVEVLDVARLPDTDDAVIALSIVLIDGERVAGATRSLIVFENGRWVDSDCDVGRALVIGGGSSGGVATPAPAQPAATAAPSTSSPLPPIASSTVFVTEGDPGDHTDEQIARSVEAVTIAAWRALLADPPLDMKAIRGLSVQSCQEQTDEELIEFAKTMRSQIGDSEIENVVQAVERIDRTRAWTSGHVEMDGIIFSEVTPTLVAFEDGQWRDADCLTDKDTSLKRPDHIDSDVRVSYIGEPVDMQHDWEEPPYELIVLAPPEMIDDDTARLAVRVTAITDVLNVEDVYFLGWLSTGFDADGNAVEWWAAYECESDAFEPATLAMGGSQEGFVCFAFDEFSDSESHPSDDRPFVLFQSIRGEDLVTVDLTQEVLPPERVTFKPDAQWGSTPDLIGETVDATYCSGDHWVEVTALSRPEPVVDADTVRVRAQIRATGEGEIELGYLPVNLATAPSEFGQIHLWEVFWETADGSRLPDSFADVVLENGETHEAFIYFQPTDAPLNSGHYSLLVWRDCFPFPVHLTQGN